MSSIVLKQIWQITIQFLFCFFVGKKLNNDYPYIPEEAGLWPNNANYNDFVNV